MMCAGGMVHQESAPLGKEFFMWFPTGYWKSIYYQLLPFIFDVKLGRTNTPLIDRSVVLFVSPLAPMSAAIGACFS